MALPDGYTQIQLPESRRDELIELDHWTFPSPVDPAESKKLPLPLTWERTRGVVVETPDPDAVPIDGAVPVRQSLAAIHSSYPFSRFPVPGAEIPVAGLTWVGVHPQHRRRGILSAMIDQHFADCVERGETVSALFAAEAAIYGSFGYGLAAQDLRLTVPRGATLRPVAGSEDLTVRIETLDPAVHGELVSDLHARAGRQPTPASGINRPGWATRETDELKTVHLDDPAAFRNGREPRRIVVVESDGEPRGYTTFRRKVDWGHTGPRGTVSTGEVVGLDPAATHRLWSTILDLDLTHEIEPFMIPLDDPIASLLVDPRAAAPKIADNVWVRIVDVPGALAARTYTTDLDLVLHVTDPRLPTNEGSWRLTATAFGPATVVRTDDAPDLSLSVTELGAAYLGGTSLAALASAGRVEEHTDGSLLRAASAFGWPVAPVCSWVF